MYTIYSNTDNEGCSFSSFSDKMIEICNSHKQDNRALAFAFILYDFENPQISKVLKDEDYWLALNSISGAYLTVFSLNFKPKINMKHRQVSGSQGMQMLTSLSIFENPSVGTNILIDRYFGEGIEVEYPAILFFQVDNDSVIDSLLIELSEKEEIQKAFWELRNYISSSVNALKKITPENRKNSREIFDCLERNVKSTRNFKNARRMIRRAGSVLGLVSSIKGLF